MFLIQSPKRGQHLIPHHYTFDREPKDINHSLGIRHWHVKIPSALSLETADLLRVITSAALCIIQ
jgi:hypothetical protein